MKKLIPLVILITGALAGSSQGQGIVAFQNSVVFQTVDPSGGSRLVYDVGSPLNAATGVRLIGTNYAVELYSATGSGQAEGSLQAIASSTTRFRSTTTVNPGKWAAGANNSQVPLGVPAGTVVTLQARAWDLNLFPSYAAALAGGGITGKSITFDFTAADPAGAASTFNMEGLQAFALVPEPSAIALSVLGVAGLLFVRRRK